MRVLLLSAYDAASHQRWREMLCEGIPDWDWTVLTLPPRHFAWRIRGNPMSWYRQPELREDYDLVLATSMVDLATLRGLFPTLATLPAALYFHENQFVYPVSTDADHGLLEAQMVSVYSAVAADRILFNSAWNRDSFLQGCEDLLSRLPDSVPVGLTATLAGKAEILPVPITVPLQASVAGGSRLELVWNHRWEYDKGPDQLLALSRGLVDAGVDAMVHIVGQQFRNRPPAFVEIESLLADRGMLGRWGYIAERSDYLALLRRCDVVLSTALHDFQGLSVLEACALGVSPLLPERVVYPEWFAPQFLYRDTDEAVARLEALAAHKAAGRELPVADVSAFSPEVLLPHYRSLLESLAA